jgi:hypothetical protein
MLTVEAGTALNLVGLSSMAFFSSFIRDGIVPLEECDGFDQHSLHAFPLAL